MGSRRGRSAAGAYEFSAKLVRRDMFFGVDVPAAVSRAIGVRGFVPVVGTANGAPFRTSLSPSGGGRHHVLLNRDVRAAARAAPGRAVAIVVRVDSEPPVHAIAEDLADALREDDVLEHFEAMPRGRRNQFLQWMERAVHEETRARRIVRLVELAHAEREKRLDRGDGG
jgi:hypothetical protein